ncbi:unnamed protein product [Polarella glacialis]|uniref:Uncharacterized protein n=1 Tax=Polarella glacialis TaxID=89957 RepID=A0A813IJ45_POLGL|nr:unnamed protein product [Polarella glacialis]
MCVAFSVDCPWSLQVAMAASVRPMAAIFDLRVATSSSPSAPVASASERQPVLQPRRPRPSGGGSRASAGGRCWLLLAAALCSSCWTLRSTCLQPGRACWAIPQIGPRRQRTQVAAVAESSESDSGRVVHILSEKEKSVILPNATVRSIDELMKEHAVEVLAAGAERTERAEGKDGIWYAYMKATRMGIWKNQVRLTCELRLGPSGSVSVDVVSFDVGRSTASGEMVFTKYEADTFSLEWKNSVTWMQQGDDLALVHTSTGRMRLALPWWFPLPDALVKATAVAGVNMMITDGQSKVAAAIAERHEARKQ